MDWNTAGTQEGQQRASLTGSSLSLKTDQRTYQAASRETQPLKYS